MIVTIAAFDRELSVSCPFDQTVVRALRLVPGHRWDRNAKTNAFPDTPQSLEAVLDALYFTGLFTAAPQELDLVTRYKQALRARRYSPRTIESYTSWVERFDKFVLPLSVERAGEAEISRFLTSLSGKSPVSAQNRARAALQILSSEVLKQGARE